MQPDRLPSPDRAGAAQRRFEAAARTAGMAPEDRWVGGYAEYEWAHLRPLLGAYGIDPKGLAVLELGCNVGGSSVVLAALGARVTGVDVDARAVAIADANLARHGLSGRGQALHVADTRALPFPDACFDVALANSVLEYVSPRQLDGVVAELHRVLRPGGRLLICGTASRLAPREGHSGRWLVNYLPTAADRLTGRPLQRGLAPWRLRRALAGRFRDQTGGGWARARAAIHGHLSPAARVADRAARSLGLSPGWFAPYIELLLRRT